MKRYAELTAKSVSFKREAISSQKNRKKILLLGTTFLVCGFFYCYFSMPKYLKTSQFVEKTGIFLTKLSHDAFPIVYAKSETKKLEISLCGPKFLEKNSSETQLKILPAFCNEAIFKSKENLLLEQKKEAAKQELLAILVGTPMEKMVDSILEQERVVAAFLVGIAFKESKFGEYSPQKNGKSCYNYWGFKGKINQTQSGYSCFSSPEEAIAIVGERLAQLTSGIDAKKPSQMTVWKCGSSCASHSPQSVQKWISDVAIYHNKIMSLDI